MNAKVYKHNFEGTGQSVFVLAKNLEDASETAQEFLDNLPDANKYEYDAKCPMPVSRFRYEVSYNCF